MSTPSIATLERANPQRMLVGLFIELAWTDSQKVNQRPTKSETGWLLYILAWSQALRETPRNPPLPASLVLGSLGDFKQLSSRVKHRIMAYNRRNIPPKPAYGQSAGLNSSISMTVPSNGPNEGASQSGYQLGPHTHAPPLIQDLGGLGQCRSNGSVALTDQNLQLERIPLGKTQSMTSLPV